jgi:hypothetical protein
MSETGPPGSVNGGRPVEAGFADGETSAAVERADGEATTLGDGTIVGD